MLQLWFVCIRRVLHYTGGNPVWNKNWYGTFHRNFIGTKMVISANLRKCNCIWRYQWLKYSAKMACMYTYKKWMDITYGHKEIYAWKYDTNECVNHLLPKFSVYLYKQNRRFFTGHLKCKHKKINKLTGEERSWLFTLYSHLPCTRN